jgi:phenylpyruvate tautomerase PptA (4-oxalocrotonate tautomerase family)
LTLIVQAFGARLDAAEKEAIMDQVTEVASILNAMAAKYK